MHAFRRYFKTVVIEITMSKSNTLIIHIEQKVKVTDFKIFAKLRFRGYFNFLIIPFVVFD